MSEELEQKVIYLEEVVAELHRIIRCILEGTTYKGQYIHLPICSGDYRKPTGESGCVCQPRN